MKKTSVIAINLKSVRGPFILGAFLSCILISILLLKMLPPVQAGKDFSQALLYGGQSLSTGAFSTGGVFSLLSVSPKEEAPKAEENAFSTSFNATEISSRSPVLNTGEVKFSNATQMKISAKDFSVPPTFLEENFSVLIVHTHTTESYTPSETYSYTPSDTDRTTDKNYNMVRVGDEIEKVLQAEGIKVYHDTTINDYPSYNGSYSRSASNISNHIKNDPSIKIVLDVHRDAIEAADGKKVKYASQIDGRSVASVMLVVGSDLSGIEHNNWKENMSFAVQLQSHISSLYPSLMRPINFRSQRFNQQLAPGGVIVEVGTNGNTLEEAILGAKYFATGLAEFIKSQ